MRKQLFFVLLMAIVTVFGISSGFTGKFGTSANDKIFGLFNKSATPSGIQINPQLNDHGIGPVKKVELGPINKKMVDGGKSIFNNKCIICHDLDQQKVGPALRNITKDRSPEFIMNLMVNYPQMLKEDPLMQDIFKKFNHIPMTDPALNQTQARMLLEYLRSVAR